MKRIAILGCENSHADAFLKCIKEKEKFRDVSVIGVYSDDSSAAEKLNEKFGVPIMESYAEAVGRIDGLVITARHGDKHYKFAKPYIESGIPMFIDKPITINEDEAVEFMRELKMRGVRICGGSSLKQDEFVRKLKNERENEMGGKTLGGYVRAPYQSENEHGGFYFYAQHLVEIMTTVFGGEVRRVFAHRAGSELTFIAQYDGFEVTGRYIEGGKYYSASVYGSEKMLCEELTGYGDSFKNEMNDMLALLRGENMKKSYHTFIKPVFIMNTILRSLKSGRWEDIPEYNV